MAYEVQCPHCETRLESETALSGNLECPACQGQIHIPPKTRKKKKNVKVSKQQAQEAKDGLRRTRKQREDFYKGEPMEEQPTDWTMIIVQLVLYFISILGYKIIMHGF